MKGYDLVLSARSRSDLIAIRQWLSQPGSGLRARLRMARISRALAELRFDPARWPTGPHPEARQRVVEGHVIIYRLDEQARQVRIIRVFAPYQDRSEA